MKKKRFEGVLKDLPGYEIYLNVNDLARGKYELKIIDKNKIIKKTHFNKK